MPPGWLEGTSVTTEMQRDYGVQVGNVSLAIDGSLGGQLGFKVARELPSRPAARATKQ